MRRYRAIAALAVIAMLADASPSGCAKDHGAPDPKDPIGKGGVITQTTPPRASEREAGSPKPHPAPDAVSSKWANWYPDKNGDGKPEPVPTIDAMPMPGIGKQESNERHVLFMVARAPRTALMQISYGWGSNYMNPANFRNDKMWTANVLAKAGDRVYVQGKMPEEDGNMTCAIRVMLPDGDAYILDQQAFSADDPGIPSSKVCQAEGILQ